MAVQPSMNTRRERAMVLLKNGYITQGEAAILMGVTRQRIGQWCRKAQIHPVSARKRRLHKLMHFGDADT